MEDEAAIGASQTAESAQAEQAAPKYFDVNEFLASQNLKAAESKLSEDEQVGLAAEPLLNQDELTMLLKEPEPEEAPKPVLVVPCPLTLEQYLRLELSNADSHTPFEYRLAARKNEAGDVVFYIHPFGRDGVSRDFTVMGELARNITQLSM